MFVQVIEMVNYGKNDTKFKTVHRAPLYQTSGKRENEVLIVISIFNLDNRTERERFKRKQISFLLNHRTVNHTG